MRLDRGCEGIAGIVMVVVLNVIVNSLLLIGTSRISGIRGKGIRFFVAAAAGGVYSGICMLCGQPLPASAAGRLLNLLLVGLIAFGVGIEPFRRCVVFMILNLTLDGVTGLTQRSEGIGVVICAGVISFVCRFLTANGSFGKRLSIVEIRHCGKVVRFEALRDTGNCLVDPVSGEKMLVIGPRRAFELTGLTKEELAAPVSTLRRGRIQGSWLVPFSSVGNENGMMLAMRFADVVLDGKHTKIVAALAAEGMDGFDALIGG